MVLNRRTDELITYSQNILNSGLVPENTIHWPNIEAMLAHRLHNIYHDGWMNIASRRFLHNIATEENPKSGLCPTLLEWLQWFFIVHSTIDSTTHLEQFGALYMHILDEKHPTRPGFEPSTPGFRAATGLIEPSVERVYTHLSTRKTLTRCCVNVGPRSWPKIKTTLGKFFMFAGIQRKQCTQPWWRICTHTSHKQLSPHLPGDTLCPLV